MEEREIDVLKNELVPEHKVLTPEEKKQLLEKMNIFPKQLPKISTTDAVIKKLKAKEGEVIKIKRNSLTAGTSFYYRIVSKE